MSIEGRSYFGGEKCVFNCLDEGGLCFMDVWGLGRCLFFLHVRYCSGKRKIGLSAFVNLSFFGQKRNNL